MNPKLKNKTMYDFLYNTEEEILRKKFTLELSESNKRWLFRILPTARLKQICRDHGIKGFSNKNKEALIELILSTLNAEECKEELLNLSQSVREVKLHLKKVSNRFWDNLRTTYELLKESIYL